MNCEDIRKNLKSFMEDLLVDYEYKDFVGHVNGCPDCKTYIGAIGSLSNQLWELGDIEAPAGLSSTALFKLRHAGERTAQSAKPSRRNRLATGILLLVILSAASYFGIKHFRKCAELPEKEKAFVVQGQAVAERKTADREAEALLGELKGIAAKLGASGKKETEKAKPAKEAEDVPIQPKAAVRVPKPLHWHFSYNDDREKGEFLEALYHLDIRSGRLASNLVVFSASAEKLEDLIGKVASISAGEPLLTNFSAGTVLRDRENRVSIYLEDKSSPSAAAPPHWHSDLAMAQKDRLYDVMRNMGGSIIEDSGDIAIVSFPKNNLERLVQQLAAMGMKPREYGKRESKEGALDSSPVNISIYFQR